MSDDDKVVRLRLVQKEPVEQPGSYDADDILDAARGNLENVVVIGWGLENQQLWFGTSPLTYAEILELLEHAKDVIKHARNERGE
jgi:hypothetical protein